MLGAHPLGDPILSFSHTFLLKNAHVGGPCPPNGSTPPTGNPGSATVMTALLFLAWVGSLAYGIGMLCAPIGSSVINKYGAHVSVVIGSILCSAGLFTSSTAQSISTLFATYSLLYGLGIAFAYTPTMCIASEYFDKYLTVATGIMVAGSATGTLMFSPITQAWIDNLGWRNAYRIHGGIILVFGQLCAYLMKPEARPTPPHTPAEFIKKSMARRLMNDLQLWKNKVFLIWVLAISLVMFGYYIPYVHLVSLLSNWN